MKQLLKKIAGPKLIGFIKQVRGQASYNARKAAQSSDMLHNAKLHLGCGDISIPGFVNVDALMTVATNLVSDITKLPEIEDGTVSEIYACHVLEHFSHDEVPVILARWYEVLKPGGLLRISVPDIDRIVKIYIANWKHFQTDGNAPWIGLIYGGQKDQYDFHKTGFNAVWLTKLLRDAGFMNIGEYPHEPHFCAGIVDNSLAKAPFEDFLSLNMLAVKPG